MSGSETERERDVVDVLISGAGPAGVATAVALVQRDPSLAGRMLVIDKARFPREKPCGGGLTGHARTALQALGLDVRVPHVPCPVGRIIYRRQRREVMLGRPVDIVRRREFDADLVAQARALGVEIVEGEGLASFSVDGDAGRVRATTTAGRALTARVLVGADGVGSRVRRALAGERRPPLRLFQAEVPAPAGWDDRVGEDRPAPAEPVATDARPMQAPARMTYDFSLMDEGLRGYLWLFPVAGGRLNVGAMHYPSRELSGAAIERLLRAGLARHGVEMPDGARGWPAWRYSPRARIGGPHLLCVGDAAGIDAATGEGISVGLEQGIVAADAIGAALASGDLRFAGYTRAVRRAVVGRELALDARLAVMLYPPRRFGLWLSCIMFDERMQALYAARVAGTEILADRKGALLAAMARHVLAAPRRLRAMAS